MGNPKATKDYWLAYRQGRYDALMLGVIATKNEVHTRTCEPGYVAGVDSVAKLARVYKEEKLFDE